MAEVKKRFTEMFFKYLEIFGLIGVGMFLGWLLFGYPAHASLGDAVYNNDVKETIVEDIDLYNRCHEMFSVLTQLTAGSMFIAKYLENTLTFVIFNQQRDYMQTILRGLKGVNIEPYCLNLYQVY